MAVSIGENAIHSMTSCGHSGVALLQHHSRDTTDSATVATTTHTVSRRSGSGSPKVKSASSSASSSRVSSRSESSSRSENTLPRGGSPVSSSATDLRTSLAYVSLRSGGGLTEYESGLTAIRESDGDAKELWRDAELHASMKASEATRIRLNPDAQHAKSNERSDILDWILGLCEHIKYSDLIAYSAVNAFDRILSNTSVSTNKLPLVALASILIMGKFVGLSRGGEPDEDELLACTSPGCTREQLDSMEWFAVSELKWRLVIVTPVHFLHVYLPIALQASDTRPDGKSVGDGDRARKLFVRLKKWAAYLNELCLRTYSVCVEVAPSLVAALCVAGARRGLKIAPEWSPRLARLTTTSSDVLKPLLDQLWERHQRHIKEGKKKKDEKHVTFSA